MTLKIEAGKYYKTRDGRKAIVGWKNNRGNWIGVVEHYGPTEQWNEIGNAIEGSNFTDLVEEWVEPKRIKGTLYISDNDEVMFIPAHAISSIPTDYTSYTKIDLELTPIRR